MKLEIRNFGMYCFAMLLLNKKIVMANALESEAIREP